MANDTADEIRQNKRIGEYTNMAKKYEAQVSPRGVLIRSEDGQEEIQLDPETARQLGLQIFQVLGPSKNLQRSASTRSATAQRLSPPAQRSAPVTQRSAVPARSAGQKVLEFEGKSSFQNPLWAQYAKDLARRRARSKADSYLKSLQHEGKDLSNCQATGQHFVKENG